MFSSRDNVKSEPILFASGVGAAAGAPPIRGRGPGYPHPFRQKRIEKVPPGRCEQTPGARQALLRETRLRRAGNPVASGLGYPTAIS